MRTRWSFKVAKVFGIDVYVHATFLVLLVWMGLAGYLQTRALGTTLEGVGLTTTVFAIIVLHELGHALTARKFGIGTRDITLLPFGGVARLQRMPDSPWQELAVALAGPAVNVVLAGAIAIGLALAGGEMTPTFELFSTAPYWTRLMWINVLIAGFNLVPAFPMDGGRALHAVLAMRMDRVRATELAARIGQAIAIALGIVGFGTSMMVVLIAIFVWIAAGAEVAAVRSRAVFERVPVHAAMLRRFAVLDPDETLADAASRLLSGSDVDFPIVRDGRLLGVLPRNELVRGLGEHGQQARVAQFMRTHLAVADPNETLDRALERAEGSEARVIPVLRDGVLVGLLTPQNVAELLMLEDALRLQRRAAPV